MRQRGRELFCHQLSVVDMDDGAALNHVLRDALLALLEKLFKNFEFEHQTCSVGSDSGNGLCVSRLGGSVSEVPLRMLMMLLGDAVDSRSCTSAEILQLGVWKKLATALSSSLMTPESLLSTSSSMQGSNNGSTQPTPPPNISAAALLQSIGAQGLLQLLQQKNHLAAVIQHRFQQANSSTPSTASSAAEHPRSSSSSSSTSPNELESPTEEELKSPSSPVEPDTPPSSRPPSSRGTHGGSRPQRKLKIYGVDEKLDIIDYAKVIGNRAAGREYNVAESSIREWRKNENKLRLQAESTHAAAAPNPEKQAFHKRLTDELISFINKNAGVTWTMVREKCQELWKQYGSQYEEGSSIMHVQGWLSRFMAKAREEQLIPEIAPPIAMPNTGISSTSSSSLLNGISMVATSSAVDLAASTSLGSPPPLKKPRASNKASVLSLNLEATTSSQSPEIAKSRRKGVPPRRVIDATLKTSSILPLDLTKKKDQNANEEPKAEPSESKSNPDPEEKEKSQNILVC